MSLISPKVLVPRTRPTQFRHNVTRGRVLSEDIQKFSILYLYQVNVNAIVQQLNKANYTMFAFYFIRIHRFAALVITNLLSKTYLQKSPLKIQFSGQCTSDMLSAGKFHLKKLAKSLKSQITFLSVSTLIHTNWFLVKNDLIKEYFSPKNKAYKKCPESRKIRVSTHFFLCIPPNLGLEGKKVSSIYKICVSPLSSPCHSGQHSELLVKEVIQKVNFFWLALKRTWKIWSWFQIHNLKGQPTSFLQL